MHPVSLLKFSLFSIVDGRNCQPLTPTPTRTVMPDDLDPPCDVVKTLPCCVQNCIEQRQHLTIYGATATGKGHCMSYKCL